MGDIPTKGRAGLFDSLIYDALYDTPVPGHMGVAADYVAELCGISRQECDELAVISHNRACAMIDGGKFKEEIVLYVLHDKKRGDLVLDVDEHPIRNCSYEAISKLKPAFTKNGVTMAANAFSIIEPSGQNRQPGKRGKIYGQQQQKGTVRDRFGVKDHHRPGRAHGHQPAHQPHLQHGGHLLYRAHRKLLLGNIPGILSNMGTHLLRNVGCARQASIGLSGGILNIILDPLLMFVLLPTTGKPLALPWQRFCPILPRTPTSW